MAYWWFMAVECESKADADSFLFAFDGSPVQVGEQTVYLTLNSGRIDDLWWGVHITPYLVPGVQVLSMAGGPESVEHTQLMTAVGNVLFERLLNAPPFQLALLGVEVESFFGFGDHETLVDDIKAGWGDACDGLVLSTALWKEAGRPSFFVPRSDGSYWIPWRGETYRG